MKKQVFNVLQSLALYILTVCLAACQFVVPTVSSSSNTTFNKANQTLDAFGHSETDRAALVQRILNKPQTFYDLTLKIQPDLLSKTSDKQHYSVVYPAGFQVQNEMSPLWQQTYAFSMDTTAFKAIMPAQLEPEQRYVLQVQTTADVQFTLNLNQQFVATKDLKADEQTAISKILLHTNDILTWEINSQIEGHITLRIYPEGQAGLIFQRQQRPTGTAQPQDILFDPSVPNGLKHLQPHEGERRLHEDFLISGIRVNDAEQLNFQSGVLILQSESPEVVQAFIARYGGSMLENHYDRYLIKLDLNTSPVADLPQLLQTYNQAIETTITQAAFASFAGLQTFTILLDAILTHPEWQPISVELNGISEPTQASSAQNVPLEDWNVDDANLGWSWWLVDANIQQEKGEQAWDYSLGTGVRVALLDQGFNPNHPEVKRRVLIGQAGTTNYNNQKDLGISGPHVKNHGHLSAMTLAAERNNQIQSAGSAPNVNVVPYHAVGCWAYETAVFNAISADIDIISISTTFDDNTFLTYSLLAIPGFGPLLFNQYWHINGNGLMQAIEIAHQQGVTVLTAAANDKQHYKKGIPGKSPFSITVGAVQPSRGLSEDKGKPKRGLQSSKWPQPGFQTLRVSDYSNYGDDLIWGPSEYIKISDMHTHSTLIDARGTSAATPFVAGIVALMKSRNPDLKPNCIRQILRETSQSHGLPVEPPVDNPAFPSGLNVKYVNALAAVKEAVKRNASCQNVSQNAKRTQTFGGVVKIKNGQKVLETWPALLPDTPADQKQKTLIRSVSDEVWAQRLPANHLVQLTGWSDIKAGSQTITNQQIEVAEAQLICPSSNCQMSNGAAWGPSINGVSFKPPVPSHNADFEITLTGHNLIPALDPAESTKFRLFFRDASDANKWQAFDVTLADLIQLSHDAQSVTIRIPANTLSVGTYHIGLANGILNTSGGRLFSGYFTGTGGFRISATGGGFSILGQPETQQQPINSYVYDRTGNRWIIPGQTLAVDPHDFVGIHFEQPIRNLEVKIGPVLVPIVDVLENLAVIGIPDDLPAGVHDAVIKASGQTLTLEQVVSKAEATLEPYFEVEPPPSAASPEYYGREIRVFNLSDNTQARVTLNGQTVLDMQGSADIRAVLTGPGTPYPLHRDRRNRFCFEAINHGGGYSFGFEMRFGDSQDEERQLLSPTPIYRDIQGKAGERTVVSENGEEDTRTGTVHQKCLITHAYQRPLGLPRREQGVVTGASQPFWVKVFNLSPGTSISVSNSADSERTLDLNHRSFAIAFDGDSAERGWHPQDYNFGLLQWHINQADHNSTYGIELYRGIHLLYAHRDGLAGHLGASNQDLEEGFFDARFRMPFYPNIPDFAEP